MNLKRNVSQHPDKAAKAGELFGMMLLGIFTKIYLIGI